MKLKIILGIVLLFSSFAFAQRQEIVKLRRFYNDRILTSSEIAKYKLTVDKLIAMPGLSESDKLYVDLYYAALPLLELISTVSEGGESLDTNIQSSRLVSFSKSMINMGNAMSAVLDHEKKHRTKIHIERIEDDVKIYAPFMESVAVSAYGKGEYKDAAINYEAAYCLRKSKVVNLYLAATSAIKAGEFDLALQYLNQLKAMNYFGEGKYYYAVNKKTGNIESFESKELRNAAISVGMYEDSSNEKIASKKGEIYRNIASILVHQGKIEEAKNAIIEAKKISPDDIELMLIEADLLLETNNLEAYKKIVLQILEKKTNAVDLLFNVGIVSASLGDFEGAKKYYKQVIEIQPDYIEAYRNLGKLLLDEDVKLLNEINALKENPKVKKRFDELKVKRNKMYADALPYFEKALQIDPKEPNIKAVLLNAYQVLEMDAKYKALKAQK